MGKEYQAQFKWILAQRHSTDDMTLESDNNLLKAIKNGLLKSQSRFKRFENTDISGAPPPSGPTLKFSELSMILFGDC